MVRAEAAVAERARVQVVATAKGKGRRKKEEAHLVEGDPLLAAPGVLSKILTMMMISKQINPLLRTALRVRFPTNIRNTSVLSEIVEPSSLGMHV